MLSDRGLRVSIGLCAAVIISAALYFAYLIFAPLAFAVLIIAIVWPLQRRLHARLPKILALAGSLLATIAILTEFASLVSWSFTRVGRYFVTDAARFQELYARTADWLEGHGVVVAGIWAEHFNTAWIISLFRETTLWINGMLTFSVVVLTYVILGLLEVDEAAGRLLAVSEGEFGRTVLIAATETAAKLRRYALVRTLMSVVTGLLVWAFALAVGLDLALEWGVIAFALNYIPFVGTVIATIFPTLIAIAQFGSWQMAIFVFVALNLIQFLVGNYLEPRISGRALSISPFVVLFAVFFWTFLWGIPGAFIGVPIVIAVLTFCDQYPSSRWIADLLGGGGKA